VRLVSSSATSASEEVLVALAKGGHGRRRPVCCLDGEGELGEGCEESVVRVEGYPSSGHFGVSLIDGPPIAGMCPQGRAAASSSGVNCCTHQYTVTPDVNGGASISAIKSCEVSSWESHRCG